MMQRIYFPKNSPLHDAKDYLGLHELLDMNDKLAKQFSGQLLVRGARHLLWDMVISEANRIMPYLNYIQDKEMVINASKQICTVVKEDLNKKQ